ncbi:MAG: 3-hydroxyacyl-CoA dehydrogenase family protein [Candidatus Freyarchaeota archaeon]|nr:3-hydroxyacyl-CoA dehydrogenase NAD-binding domain-containing protein [Candidatus Freyrarchaeum guaymaensis]
MAGEISTVSVVGAGFMGRQIAAWAAIHGYRVRVYDISPEALENAKEYISQFINLYYMQEGVEGNPEEDKSRVTYHGSLPEAVADADLVIEAVPEKLELKKEVFAQIDKAAPPHAIIATNSSSIPVSKIEDAVKRKDKVLNIHFYAPIPDRPMADIMRGSKTSDETFEKGKEWIESIDCVPLVVKKECLGFVFNRVWRAIKKEALKIWAGGYADFRDVDRAWMIFTGMKMGPFAMMDGVGLDVVYDIEMSYYNESGNPDDKPPEALKEMIERGELGMKTGKGFYDWTAPEFMSPDFIKPKKKR